MTETIDARGLACPEPVIRARKAMQETEHVVIAVDSETARENVSHMAQKAGWQVDVTADEGEYQIELTKRAAAIHPEPLAVGKAEALSGPLVLLVASDSIGRGDPELGAFLMKSLLRTLTEAQTRPQTILFLNAGVRLACQDSPVLEDLCALEAGGIDLLACGTCLGYYGLKDKLAVGQVSNMADIAEAMMQAGKVVTL